MKMQPKKPSLKEVMLTWLSPRQAARQADVSDMTMYSLIWEEKIHAYQIDGRWKVDPVDLARLLAERPKPAPKKRADLAQLLTAGEVQAHG